MKPAWNQRIARAVQLLESYPAASELLTRYRDVARLQRSVSDEIASGGNTDVRTLARHFPALLALIGPTCAPSPAEYESLLLHCWESTVVEHNAGTFLARILLQPYAEYLASRSEPVSQSSDSVCPFCHRRPAVAVLRGEGDGAKRSLICSLCSTEWQYRRVVCANCGEEHKDKLPVYTAEEFDYVRVEACDSCRTYLKAVDLTRNGHAVPVVDELATVSLNIWAEEHGYTKFEPNLLGM